MKWVQLSSSLNILWHCLSLGLEWKHLFSPVATAEFSKFAGILSTALSQHHLLGFEIAQLKLHHLHYLTSHSRMSGSMWVITLLWLSGSWRSFLYSSSVYSCLGEIIHNQGHTFSGAPDLCLLTSKHIPTKTSNIFTSSKHWLLEITLLSRWTCNGTQVKVPRFIQSLRLATTLEIASFSLLRIQQASSPPQHCLRSLLHTLEWFSYWLSRGHCFVLGLYHLLLI